MFIRSLMNRDVIYRKGGFSWVIKAGTVTSIDENRVSAKELKNLYGSRIIVISRDAEEDKVAEMIIKKQEKVIKENEVKSPVGVLDETSIDAIIAQIEAEESLEDEEVSESLLDTVALDVADEEKVKLEEAKKLEEKKARVSKVTKGSTPVRRSSKRGRKAKSK